jgi:hypothetical protein
MGDAAIAASPIFVILESLAVLVGAAVFRSSPEPPVLDTPRFKSSKLADKTKVKE